MSPRAASELHETVSVSRTPPVVRADMGVASRECRWPRLAWKHAEEHALSDA